MTKTEKFVGQLKEILPQNFKIVDIDGTTIKIECSCVPEFDNYHHEDIAGPWEIKNGNKFAIWNDGKFVGRCDKTPEGVIEFLKTYTHDIASKLIDRDINRELADYLVEEFKQNDIKILIRMNLPHKSRYSVSYKDTKFVIESSFEQEKVKIFLDDNNKELKHLVNLSLSDPNINKNICNYIMITEDKL